MSKMLAVVLALVGFGFPSLLRAEVFYQDEHYIYRAIPDSIDVSDRDLLSRLLQASTQEVIRQTKVILEASGKEKAKTALEEVHAEIASFLKVQENLTVLNDQVTQFRHSKKTRGWSAKDLMPKSLTVFVGGSGSISTGVSISGSLCFGLNIFIDKVDRISKRQLIELFNLSESELSLKQIRKIFGRIDPGFRSSLRYSAGALIGGVKRTVEVKVGGETAPLTVYSQYKVDTAPVVVAAPAVGVGVGGSKAVRVGIGASWWRGNKIFEPEDLYGLGLAYSQDVSIAGAGYNFKAGVVNSENAPGWFDYFYSSFSFSFGVQAEFAPAKINLLFFKEPLWLLEKLGIEEKAEEILNQRTDKTIDQLWEELRNEEDPGNRPG